MLFLCVWAAVHPCHSDMLCYAVMRFESNEAVFDFFTTHCFVVRVGRDGSLPIRFLPIKWNTNRNVMVVVHPFIIANSKCQNENDVKNWFFLSYSFLACLIRLSARACVCVRARYMIRSPCIWFRIIHLLWYYDLSLEHWYAWKIRGFSFYSSIVLPVWCAISTARLINNTSFGKNSFIIIFGRLFMWNLKLMTTFFHQ